MRKFVLLIAVICITATSKAQINEIGMFLGGSNYIGDIGPEYYINPNNFMVGGIYKVLHEKTSLMANSLKELALGLEFNYFEYNLDDHRKTHTPYLLIEVAAFNYSIATKENAPKQYEYESKTSFAIPFGIGYKTKLINDLAIAFEIRARYTFEDDLDYNNNNINSLTFGKPDSNDWYMLSGISVVYSFGRPPCFATPY